VLQGVAGCYRALQGVAVCCRGLHGVAGCCSVLQCRYVQNEFPTMSGACWYVAVCCNVS